MSAARLVAAMRDPATVLALDGEGWTALWSVARAEQMAGNLAWRLRGLAISVPARRLVEDALVAADRERVAALWEAEAARRALAGIDAPVVLLKGTAYHAAGLRAGQGRSVGDLDLLVPPGALAAVEAALIAGGWEWVKSDPYDDHYYRDHMHELPPLIHRERDRMADVHHTILPPTAARTPDAAALIADAVPLGNGLSVLSPNDRICHAAAHLFADGDLSGGLRNLWDIHQLLGETGTDGLAERAVRHQLTPVVARAQRLAAALYGTGGRLTPADRLFCRRLLARDGWGRATRLATQAGFYVRSHLLRMPPAMLGRHLWTKWRMRHRGDE